MSMTPQDQPTRSSSTEPGREDEEALAGSDFADKVNLESADLPPRPEDSPDDIFRQRCAEIAQEAEREAEQAAAGIVRLAGAQLTPEVEAEWLELLKELTPGPYSKLAFEHLGDVARQEGPVRSLLLDTQERWNSTYAQKGFYSEDLRLLDSVLSQQPRASLFAQLASHFRGPS
jgi:hypothetical protein